MEKKDLIKFENAAIRAAGSRMAKMFQPMGEHEGDKEARRAFYEGFQEGAAFYRLLSSRIDDEFANLIEGARLDSGPEEDTHSVMEMCMRNGIPVITATQKAPGKNETEKLYEDVKNYLATVHFDPEVAKKFVEEHTTESEPTEPKKDDSAVTETMEYCIKATPEQCRACDSNEDCPRSCADLEKIHEPQKRVTKKFDFPGIEKIREQQKMFDKKPEFSIEQAKAEPEKKVEEPKGETAQSDPDCIPWWKRPMDKIEKVLENLGVKFERQGDENILYLRFKRDIADLHFKRGSGEYTIYFEKQEDGNYKVAFSERNAYGGKVLLDAVVTDNMTLLELERAITEHVKGW